MNAWQRWTVFLVGWHLQVALIFFLWDEGRRMPVWTGSVLAFSLPTVQFTWSLTMGLLIGPSRKRRSWFWTTLLLSFIPLSFVRILCFLAYHFVGLYAALCCLTFCLAILFIETFMGIYFGLAWREHLRR